MKNRYVVFLVLFCTSLISLSAQEEFEVFNVIAGAAKPPSEAAITAVCAEDNQRLCAAYRMVDVALNDDFVAMHDNFGTFTDLYESEQLDSFARLVIYRYANYLEIAWEANAAKQYYSFLREHSESHSLLGVLAEISFVGLSQNQENKADLLRSLDALLLKLTYQERVAALLKLNAYIGHQEAGEIFEKYVHIDSLDVNSIAQFFLFAEYYATNYAKNESLFQEVNTAISQFSEIHTDKYNRDLKYHILYNKSKKEGNYADALKYARSDVEETIGSFNSITELFEKYDASGESSYSDIERFAGANLYLTRLGKGIEPVKYAFDLYREVYRRTLNEKLSAFSGLTASRPKLFVTSYHNLLIVGNYLYENTGDERYLEESLAVLDGFVGAGTFFWGQARERMRRDSDFARDLELLLSNGPSVSVDTELSLRDLFMRLQEIRRQREKFKQDYPDFYAGLGQITQLNFAQLRQELSQDTSAVVGFYIAEGSLYRAYISSDTVQISVLHQDRAEALALTRELAAQVANPELSPAALATSSHRLYDILFAGLDSLLPPKVHIVATGELINVPFAALRKSPAGEPARYLGVEHAISQQFSIASMQLLTGQARNPRYAQPLALAPSFSGDVLAASELRQAGFALNPLVYNETEVQHLEAQGSGKYLYGKRATLYQYRRAAADYGIIHLASHAISSQLDGIRSRIFLLNEAGEPEPLYAGDLGGTTLEAELVVLSACETGGGGRDEVEGRVGLTRAYLSAGARAVVSSCWAVDDYATAEMMEDFYAATASGAAPHEALRRARAAYLEEHPEAPVANWAAFEAYGGMVAPRWDREGGRNWWLWGGAMAALFGLGLGAASLRRAA